MRKRTKLAIILPLLLGLIVFGGWLLSAYATTKQAVSDVAAVLHACLTETPDMSMEQAESILVDYARSGSLNIRLTADSTPGDIFGNPLHIEFFVDARIITVYVRSPGIDGFPGTFDDIGHSISSSSFFLYATPPDTAASELEEIFD